MFTIQKDSSNKISNCCYRCQNYKCRRKFPVRINTFFSELPFHKLQEVYEILLCFICYDFNAEKAQKYLEDTKNIKISKNTLLSIYQEFRDVIHLYMNIVYETELISEQNKREYFSADESIINHSNNTQIWLLGVINNTTKQFRIVGTLTRDANAISKFIKKFICPGNIIITDSWQAYNWLNEPNSGYSHINFNHSFGSFVSGLTSTSHMESIWSIIKAKIKNIYYVIPNKNLFLFIRKLNTNI